MFHCAKANELGLPAAFFGERVLEPRHHSGAHAGRVGRLDLLHPAAIRSRAAAPQAQPAKLAGQAAGDVVDDDGRRAPDDRRSPAEARPAH